eukprot:PhF_6_TR41775/c0_g1_i1/m.63386
MENDLTAVSSLSYVSHVTLEGDMLVVTFQDGEDVTIHVPDYPNGEALAETSVGSYPLGPGKLIDYVRQLKTFLSAHISERPEWWTSASHPIQPCAAFKRDIDEMKALFGESSVLYKPLESLFSENFYRASVEIKLDPMPLMSGHTAECYKVVRDEPIVIRLTISDASTYSD